MSKCKVCGGEFTKFRPMQKVCSLACAKEIGSKTAKSQAEKERRKQEKAERAALKARKEAILTRSDWIKRAQKAFNAFIRARDKDKPCICCGKPLAVDAVGGGFDAGHYRSVGSAPHLRFDETNCHGQTKQCNRYGAGRAVDYRIGLIARIGLQAVELIEADHCERKYTIEGLKAIEAHYKLKAKELLK